jgi:tetratricopeptide (TPR) repeat protein
MAALLYERSDFQRGLGSTVPISRAFFPEVGAAELEDIALRHQDRGDLDAAQPLLERALAIREKACGRLHLDTATSLNNLARLYHAQGDLAAAQPLLKRAVDIYGIVLGFGHPDTATCLNNFARLCQDQAQGDLDIAQRAFQAALEVREKVCGPNHPDTATSLNDLARLYQDRGDLATAQPLFQRARAIYETALGTDHPATSLNLAPLRPARSKKDRVVDLSSEKEDIPVIMDDAAIDLNAAADELGLSKKRAFEAMKREAAEAGRETTGRATATPRPEAPHASTPPRRVTADELFEGIPPEQQAKRRQKYDFAPELLSDPVAIGKAESIANARTYKRRKGIAMTPAEDARGKMAESLVKKAKSQHPSAG